ncbi:MAG: HAD family phosphatase [Clostridia bacterium]|nr:HAD family phosphatase [Clostridia bacterium]
MLKNFIFDLGHVLTPFDAYALTRVYVKDEEKVALVAETVFDRLYWDRLDAGTIEDDEVTNGFLSRLPKELHQAALDAYNNWIINLQPTPGMCELVQELKNKGGRIFLLSNTSVNLYENYHRSPWMKELFAIFDGLIVSGVIKKTKPNREIYEYALDTYGLCASETIFIDDNEKNIEGCRACGMEGYLFDGDAESLKKYLETR